MFFFSLTSTAIKLLSLKAQTVMKTIQEDDTKYNNVRYITSLTLRSLVQCTGAMARELRITPVETRD